MTRKGQTRGPNTHRAQSRKQVEMPFSNNRYIVCCKAVRSTAILATAWLVVFSHCVLH